MYKFLLLQLGILLTLISPAFASAEGAASSGSPVAAGYAIAIAAFGGAISQAIAASKALEAIGRNPGASEKIFTPMIIGLALIESLVIYVLVIAFLIK